MVPFTELQKSMLARANQESFFSQAEFKIPLDFQVEMVVKRQLGVHIGVDFQGEDMLGGMNLEAST